LLPPDLRYCRIFEVVAGARITGRPLPNAPVRVALALRVERGPRLTYRTSARADATGRYVITVPYPTEGREEEEVRAEGAYRIRTIEGIAVSVRVSGSAVLEGRGVPAGR